MSDKSGLLSEEVLAKYRVELRDKGTVLVAPGTLFTQNDLAEIDRLQLDIPEAEVRKGDAGDSHRVFVKRLREDRPGRCPSNVNGTASAQIVELLERNDRAFALRNIFGASSDYIIRRCQMHRMPPGSFVGVHLDAESDPDFEYSVIVQLAEGFEGGEFVVYPTERDAQVFRPLLGTVVITTCRFRHEVKPVHAGERRSLVYFCSKRGGANRRIIKNSAHDG
ncbi:2OG-Fe(II) oxygenase [Bradyrhizobium pachyrhizi]|uniref:2OG-Fe(II) oxygenase n=1 Tax=Bradyrhizobium pachyrhizi TaxID=280333 RepID=UPI0024B1E9AB|nr:2OG-Fe(II) oxygenase [Bradyrhizobium pachyrhizi]WFU54566.1 2OG-Fe(II) oxygenase [Bradyrhizobium pachyrhizi]